MESMYRDGEWIKPRRVRVALEKKTTFGAPGAGLDLGLLGAGDVCALSEGGVSVPAPIERTEDAILMTYVGDEELAAPQLRNYRPDDTAEAQDLFDQLLRAIERMLYLNVVHGDLSPYNLLVWEGTLVVIDVPQAVDPRKNRHARSFLERDLERSCGWAEAHGLGADASRRPPTTGPHGSFADLIPEDLRGLTM